MKKNRLCTKHPCVLVDLDYTLVNSSHRDDIVSRWIHNGGPQGECAYNLGNFEEDTMYDWCANLLYGLSLLDIEIIFVTGRGEECRQETRDWLLKYGGDWLWHMKPLLMRPLRSSEENPPIKLALIQKYVFPFYRPILALDDEHGVVEMYRGEGIPCLDTSFNKLKLTNASN